MQQRHNILKQVVVLGSLFACTAVLAQQKKSVSPAASANEKAMQDAVNKSKAKKTTAQRKDSLAGQGVKLDLYRNADTTGMRAVGIVRDAATGKPLAAVNISVPDFSAALTDDNGRFSIKVPNYNATLFVSGEGFQAKEVALKGNKRVEARLYEDAFNSVYDAAYLPLGPKPANQTPFAVTSMSMGNSWNRNTESVDGYLEGQVAGLNATMRSGTPNAGAYLALRGYSSLYATNQPLIVVDGMPYDINDYGTTLLSKHYTNPLAQIDPRDIKNITVVQDGGSLYGTKGANGVILITTGHAEKEATTIDAAVYGGVNFQPKELPVMQSADYRTFLTDMLKTRGWSDAQIQAQPYMSDDKTNPNYYRYHNETNWQKQVLQNSATTNAYLKVTGGDNIARYALSLGYLTNAGITQATSLTKYNMRLSADLNLSKRLTAVASFAYTYYEQKVQAQGFAAKTNPMYLALTKAPFMAKNAIADNGTVSPNLADVDTLGIGNPAAIIANALNSSKSYRFYGSIALNYKLTRLLTIKSLIGATIDETREQLFIPRAGVADDTLSNAVAYSRLGGQAKRLSVLYNDTYLDYTNTFKRIHSLNVRLGARYQTSKNEQDQALSYNSATDNFITVGTGVASLRQLTGGIGKYNWMNTYLAADYTLANKYFLSFNMAADASSRFGSDIPGALKLNTVNMAIMPSVGAGWLISSESFMRPLKFVDLLKVRATVSKTGNDDIGNYTAQQSYVSQNLLGVEGLVRGNVANPHLQWEVNTKFNEGIDMALFGERLIINADVYQNKTTKMLAYETLPIASGFDYAITNSGAMKTTGANLAVSARIINKKLLKWDVGFNIAAFKNRVTQLPSGSVTSKYGGATILTAVGGPANVFYGYKTNGVFTSDAEAAASGLMKKMADGSTVAFKGGDVRFIDVNGDKMIDDNDRQVIGNPNPDFFGGFNTKLTWKRISLEALFTFSKGNRIYNGVRAMLESESSVNNQLMSVVNRWRAPGQVTNMPKATWGDPMGNSSFSDRWIEDGSFLRLKMVTITYNLPFKEHGAFKGATLYVTGNNLVTFTKYLGFDPEFYSSESVFARGVDVGLEPQFKSIIAGVRVGF
ncbi:TonB-dependent receptor [Russula earlei]|uniref:TonB-dependent receptor n=1 Tax=Russula earlei TaxID=71964 RepID=A0ACC0U432_9AGAM|nr:TonB-dependent receptor [Russula earlei]